MKKNLILTLCTLHFALCTNLSAQDSLQKNVLLDEIVVKATRFGDYNPSANTELSNKELVKFATLKDITQMLELQASVVATSEAGSGMGATNFRIRGIDPSRINVTINGMSLNDPESQSVFWNNMPDFSTSVSSLQLTRGVGSSTNGSAAFGANLNILTNELRSEPYAEVGFFAGSFMSFKENLLVGTGLMKNGLSFDARISKLNSDGFVRNAFSDHSAFTLNAAWRDEKNLFRANVIYGKQKTGITWNGVEQEVLFDLSIPEKERRRYNSAGMYSDENGEIQYYDNESDNYQQTHVILSYSRLLKQYFDLNIAARYTRGDGYYEDYKLDRKLANYNLPNIILEDGSEIKRTDLIQRKLMANNTYSGNFSLNYRKNIVLLTAGGDFNYYEGAHFGNVLWVKGLNIPEINDVYEWYRNTGNKMDGNIFVKANVEVFKGFHLYGDLQYRYVNYKMTGIDDDLASLEQSHTYHFFNPKAGVFYEINKNQHLYFSFANAHREPTRSNFKEANNFPEKTPKAESLFDYELGYTVMLSKFSGNINFYYMDYYNQLVPTGELSGSGYDIMRNVARSYRRGIEISLAYQPIKQLEFSGSLTLSQNKIQNFLNSFEGYDENWNDVTVLKDLGNTALAYSPSILASGQMSYEAISNLFFRVTSKYVGKQYFDNTQSERRKLDPYWVNNFQIDYSIFPKKVFKEIQFKFQINNFANSKYCNDAIGGSWYENVGSAQSPQGLEKQWASYFPQAGINFMGGIVLRF